LEGDRTLSPIIKAIIDGIIEREGSYVNHPSDRGGATCWGITEAVARKNGYTGLMQDLPRELAFSIYLDKYVIQPGFDKVAVLSETLAEELVDSGVNFGQTVPIVWLQRWLTAFNRQAVDYPDLRPDGVLGPVTLRALDAYLKNRGKAGEAVLFTALNCSQGARYLELAEGREANESFLFGWMSNRVMEIG
jgi:lysozyme family protein